MIDKKHPYDLQDETKLDGVAHCIAGFIGGGIAGLVIGVVGTVLAVNFAVFVPLELGFFGVLGSVFLFAIIGAIWPKWFAWILDILSFW